MKITVIVPTIDGRSTYLESCLRTCVAQRADYEIVVSDNPGGMARDVVASFSDSRIRYVRPPSYLPMSAHWDFAMSQVTGDVVTVIGDDDGLMPGCINRVTEIISQTGALPLHHALANYWWPDAAYVARRGKVEFFHSAGWGQRIVSSAEFLRLIARARARYLDGPMIYHNFIQTDLLRRISRDGVYFPRSSPDVYSAFAIAANTEYFTSTDELLTISGQGAKANGQAVRSGEAAKFVAEAKQHYPSRFAGRTVQLVLIDSLIEARHMPAEELRLVLSEAKKHGIVMKLGASIAKLVISRVARRHSSREPSHAFDIGKIIHTDAVDVYQATQKLQAMLDVAPYNLCPIARTAGAGGCDARLPSPLRHASNDFPSSLTGQVDATKSG